MADQTTLTANSAMRQMIDDMMAIASIPDETLAQLGDRLEEQSGFLSSSALVDIVSEVIPDDRQGQATFNALQNLRPDDVDQLVESIGNWRESSPDNREHFGDDLFGNLEQNLKTLVRDYASLNRGKKADRLRNILGNELQGAVFICDARPVFNKERDQIEGMIPITTLKLVYERQNMETEEIELTLNADQLKSLREDAEKAEKKITTLSESIMGWLPESCLNNEE